MFDLRYHVVSLAAVFLALIIGILVGVGIASQTSVSESDRKVLEQRIADLQRDLDGARNEADLLRRQQDAGTSYIEASYPTVMNGRLRGTRIALLFLGPVASGLRSAVDRTVNDASGPPITRSRALQLPVDPQAVLGAVPSELGSLSLDEIGRRLGRELVAGGDTPLSDALATVIVQDSRGGSEREVDAVVVAQTAAITEPATRRFIAGLYAGLAGSGVPVVGVERSEEQSSRISIYKARGLSSVDSVDTAIGRVALAVLLAGGEEGQYGMKPTADAVLPSIEPLPLAPPPGG
jgi:hypothetical protein